MLIDKLHETIARLYFYHGPSAHIYTDFNKSIFNVATN